MPNFAEKVVMPFWLRWSIPWVTWRIPEIEKAVYITFDDGPTNKVTYRLLETLAEFNAKATFFCLGENVEKRPKVFNELVAAGHTIGNHSFSHPNGWQTDKQAYIADVNRCQQTLVDQLGYAPKYFRPPYGRATISQMWSLRREFEIVMWDVLSMDYMQQLSAQEVAENVTSNVKPGSIVVLHDSQKARERVVKALPLILRDLNEKGFVMKCLPINQAS